MKDESIDRSFVFSVIEDDGENVIIEVSEEDYKADLAAGLDEDEVLRPGRYKMKRGGFLTRHPELKPRKRARRRLRLAMMRLPKFEYHVPRTIAEAVRIMGDVGRRGSLWPEGPTCIRI